MLTIKPGAFVYAPNVDYSFTISTTYLNVNYSQELTIQIDSSSIIPIANLK
jgi:hypothetical protein